VREGLVVLLMAPFSPVRVGHIAIFPCGRMYVRTDIFSKKLKANLETSTRLSCSRGRSTSADPHPRPPAEAKRCTVSSCHLTRQRVIC
jgi:hypothetical protein